MKGEDGYKGGRELLLRNYIPIGAPARREPADGSETAMRVSLGFEPAWFTKRCGVDFSREWHTDPIYRYGSLKRMKEELKKSFPTVEAWSREGEEDLATISGCYGIYLIPALFGFSLSYDRHRWPLLSQDRGPYTEEEIEKLDVGSLLQSPIVEELFMQMESIAASWGTIGGYLNWQGVLNNAFHIRGQEIFIDLYERQELAHRLFAVITQVMIELAKRAQERQRASGFFIDQLCVSNCTLNMISSETYREFLLPYDKRIAGSFQRFGVHTCNWNVTPYLSVLQELPMGYLDMGMESSMVLAKEAFPKARRAVLYSPVSLEEKSSAGIRKDMEIIYRELAPCDIVMADITFQTRDKKVHDLLKICKDLESNEKI